MNGDQISSPVEGPIIDYTDVNVSLVVPYFSNGKEARIFDINGNSKLTIDLGSLAIQINYAIGYGGATGSTANYNIQYILTPQPTGVLDSNNYVCYLGAQI